MEDVKLHENSIERESLQIEYCRIDYNYVLFYSTQSVLFLQLSKTRYELSSGETVRYRRDKNIFGRKGKHVLNLFHDVEERIVISRIIQ